MTTEDDAHGIDAEDQALLAEIGGYYGAADAPPVAVLARAKSIAHMADFDGELAELLDDAGALAGVRAENAGLLRFRASALTIELQIPDHGEPRLVGQILGGTPTLVHLEAQVDGEDLALESACDEDGFFSFPMVPVGPTRLRIDLDGDVASVLTSWFTL